jgi:hypothetical protein
MSATLERPRTTTANDQKTLSSYTATLDRVLDQLPVSSPERSDLADLRELLADRKPLTAPEAAHELGLSSPQTVKNWLESGMFPGAYQTSGGHWRFPLEEVLRVRREMQETRDRNTAGKYRLKNAGRYEPRDGAAY